MRPLGHTRFRRLARWTLALLLLPPLLLLGSLEALYRYGLSRVGELPRAPQPRTDFASRVLWASVAPWPPQLQPLWPWSLVGPRPGAGVSWLVARPWLASRPPQERTPMLNWHFHGLALSVWVSRHWTAEEVMASYAENASFGGGLIGIDAAARWYFGEEPARLALHEAALLAALAQAPARNDPLCRPEAALERRDVVLSRLQALGWISEAQREEARRQPLLHPEVMERKRISCTP